MALTYGSIGRLVAILFRKDGQNIRVKPKVATTYTGAVELELPPLAVGSDVLVAEGTVQSLSQKTLLSPTLSGNVAGSPVFTGTPALTLNDTSNSILQGGNTRGAAIAIGSNDNFPVALRANGEIQLSVKPASATSEDVAIEGVGALMVSKGTTAQRPSSAVNGFMRYNTTLESFEFYQNGSWQQPSVTPPTVPFVQNWLTADGTTKAVTHSLGTQDVSVEIYDIASGQTIMIDSIVRTSASVVTLVASEAPPATSWRVIVYGV
jgi:hypothetical protein